MFKALWLTGLLVSGTVLFAQTTQGPVTLNGPDVRAHDVGPSEVPSGAEIAVRTNDAIDAGEASEGQTYAAEVVDDVRSDNGQVLIPRQSRAQLIVRTVSSGGTVGSSELALALQSVTVNGHRYLVRSEDLAQKGKEGIGKNKRTAEMVGGGAVLGTLLGAIAGGGKGAAIGAVAGAAAGGTAQVITRGKKVTVPAETVLRFQLDRPLRLAASE